MDVYEHWYRILDDFRWIRDSSLALHRYGERSFPGDDLDTGPLELVGGSKLSRHVFVATSSRAGMLLVETPDLNLAFDDYDYEPDVDDPYVLWFEHVANQAFCLGQFSEADPSQEQLLDVWKYHDAVGASVSAIHFILEACYPCMEIVPYDETPLSVEQSGKAKMLTINGPQQAHDEPLPDDETLQELREAIRVLGITATQPRIRQYTAMNNTICGRGLNHLARLGEWKGRKRRSPRKHNP